MKKSNSENSSIVNHAISLFDVAKTRWNEALNQQEKIEILVKEIELIKKELQDLEIMLETKINTNTIIYNKSKDKYETIIPDKTSELKNIFLKLYKKPFEQTISLFAKLQVKERELKEAENKMKFLIDKISKDL